MAKKYHGFSIVESNEPNHDGKVTGDVALLFDKESCDVILSGIEELHDEPPGQTTDRQAVWAIVKHLPSGRVIRAVGEHTVAAVERGNRLNAIPRSKFWLVGIKRTITIDRMLKKKAKKATGQYGSAVVTGDFNWSDEKGSLIRGLLGVYFKSNYQVLGRPAGRKGTLGRRIVDIVWIRGYIRFVSHRIFHTKSDHEGLLVLCKLPSLK